MSVRKLNLKKRLSKLYRNKIAVALVTLVIAFSVGDVALALSPAGVLAGNPWAPSSGSYTYAYVIGDSANLSTFAVEYDGISGKGCAALLNYFGQAAASTNGGQVVGLIGANLTTSAPGSNTHQAATVAVRNWTNANPQSCTTVSPTTSGTSGNNSIAIWFDMAQM